MSKSNIVMTTALLLAAGVLSSALWFYPHRVVHGQATVNGIPNQNIVLNGLIPIYDLTGTLISGTKCAQGTVTSASGSWTANYSGMGFTNVTKVLPFAMSPNTSLAGAYSATLTSFTPTSATGNVVTGTTLAVLNTYSLALGTTPVSVFVQVCGS